MRGLRELPCVGALRACSWAGMQAPCKSPAAPSTLPPTCPCPCLPLPEGRASRAEALLRKVDERKAAAEVERRRAAEAAARLEQQALELQSRLEAAQHRERAAQAEAERLRCVGEHAA